MSKFYLTTPIYYPNAELHMGSAYTSVLADIIARYHRGRGEEVYFLTGSDEHAGKVAKAAVAAGKEPKVFVDEMAESFKKSHASLSIAYDDFIQTTDEKKHWPGAIALWKAIDAAGDIYKKKYSGLYCHGCEEFKQEKDLVDGLCPLHNQKPEFLEEENYFFKLSKYTEKIRELIESGSLQIIPSVRKNEILALINEGLEDISFSRSVKNPRWGIPVPGDDSQVMYVWCDALANYISALGYGTPDDANFKKFWPADLHILGKDILRFHAAVWPGMLLSAGLPTPKKILCHGFVTSGGKKMSKTLGNIIDPKELVAEYGADAVRYYIAREISPFDDGDLTREKFKEAYNANLANGLGNLVARIMKMATAYLDGPVKIDDAAHYRFAHFEDAMGKFEIQKAANIAWEALTELDREIEETEPFKLIKTDPEKAKEIVCGLVVGLSKIMPMLAPIVPETAGKITAAIRAHTLPENLFMRK
jgi:methionyl-tRNA synthetase